MLEGAMLHVGLKSLKSLNLTNVYPNNNNKNNNNNKKKNNNKVKSKPLELRSRVIMLKTRKIPRGTPYSCPTIWVASWNLKNTILYETEFQNPQIFQQSNLL
jgi:hypothetical protein